MANRPAPMGLSRELAAKMAARYCSKTEKEMAPWMAQKTGIPYEGHGADCFGDYLRDGTVLHAIARCYVKDNSILQYEIADVSKIGLQAMKSAKMNDNIGKFLKVYSELYNQVGGKEHITTFQTVDLAEKANMGQVQAGLGAFFNLIHSLEYDNIPFATKESTKNVRNFDEATKKAGLNVIGLQMGTNQVASQKGMTGYGQGRQIIHKTN